MKALDELSKAAGSPVLLTATDVRTRCESGDQQACLAYGLLAVRAISCTTVVYCPRARRVA
jgi:hypothetical protein